MPKVSVIIAVYNVEKYIDRCARSLFSQTLSDIEYLFIDDCTPDNSISILNKVLSDFPERKKQTRILRMDSNSKQAAVRSKGITEATGNFIIHCDPDDWIDSDTYEKMYNTAMKTGADIVTCRIQAHSGNKKIGIPTGNIFSGSGTDALKSFQVNHSLMNKLVKKDLYSNNNILPFPNINYGEDCNTVMRLYYYASKVVGLEEAYYHYDKSNDGSITKSKIEYLLNTYAIKNMSLLESFFRGKGEEYNVVLAYLKYETKSSLLNTAFEDNAAWMNYFPECHKYIYKFNNLPRKFKYAVYIASHSRFLIKLLSKYLNRI